MSESFRVRVPATTANVGPGFDCLGIALELYNEVEIRPLKNNRIEFVCGESASGKSGALKMVTIAARIFFEKINQKLHGFQFSIRGDVPVARGLGSSVTLRLGVLMGLNEWMGRPLKKSDLLDLVAELEGHPDNAAPALYGGLVLSGVSAGRVVYLRKELSKDLKFVALIPGFEVETKRARELLPKTVDFADAVFNVGRSSMLTAAFWEEDDGLVGEMLEDRLHQPYRARLVPQLFPALNAAKLAGAIGGWLSGSGSTIMALTRKNPDAVGSAMLKIFQKVGSTAKILILEPNRKGAVLD